MRSDGSSSADFRRSTRPTAWAASPCRSNPPSAPDRPARTQNRTSSGRGGRQRRAPRIPAEPAPPPGQFSESAAHQSPAQRNTAGSYIGDSQVDYLLAKHFNLTFYGINYNGDNVKSYRGILEISKQIKKIQNK